MPRRLSGLCVKGPRHKYRAGVSGGQPTLKEYGNKTKRGFPFMTQAEWSSKIVAPTPLHADTAVLLPRSRPNARMMTDEDKH